MLYDKKVDPFYKTPAWRRARRQALERDLYLCVECMGAYRRREISAPKSATVVHHIKPLAGHPEMALDLDNLESLCDACHNKKHPEKGAGRQDVPTRIAGVRIVKV